RRGRARSAGQARARWHRAVDRDPEANAGTNVITLLVATNNAHKRRELVALLDGLGIEPKGPADLGVHAEPVEDGATFAENAAKKALHYHRLTGWPTLADDSGLEVPALGGAPGVYSARYAGAHATDAENRAKLLAALARVPAGARMAR